MKRLPLAILALLLGGCQPAPPPAKDPGENLRPKGAESAAFEAARGFLEADLRKRYGGDLGGWRVPDVVTEAGMLRDFQDPSRYEVTLPARAEGQTQRSYTVQMRRAGDDWHLLRVYPTTTVDGPGSIMDTP